MSIEITVVDVDHERGVCGIGIDTGNAQVRSYPQSFFDSFRDLQANKKLISERRLASFFFGEEPILNVDYLGDDLIMAYIFRKRVCGTEKLRGEFSVDDALSGLENAIGQIEAIACINESDRRALLKQFAQDFADGAYDAYLKK